MTPAARRQMMVLEGLLTRLRPGAVLRLLARTPVPVWRADHYADRLPEEAFRRDAGHSPVLDVRAQAPADGAGPLAGEAVGVKDAIDVAGWTTTLGLRNGVVSRPTEDAPIVARVRRAGGWVRARTKMTELGIDGLGAGVLTDMPHNPLVAGHFPGGSSTGSAVAVATGLVRYAIGTDGLGSVRIPAAMCGLVGLKPGRGRLPEAGCHSPSPSMAVSGPIARTVADAGRFWQVLADEPVEPLAPRHPGAVGVIRTHGPEKASRAQRLAFARALEAAGLRAVAVDVPGAERCTFVGGMVAAAELADSPYASEELTPSARLSVALGRALREGDRRWLADEREALTQAALRALDQVEVLAMPTTAFPPPAITRRLLDGEQDLLLLRGLGAYTPLANLAGLPSISVPAGRDERGRPLGVMFVGAPGSETMLLRLALVIEQTGVGARPIA